MSSLTFQILNDAAGLYSSKAIGGDIFYNRRLSRTQYFGVTYGYVRAVETPSTGEIDTQVNTLLPFYTYYFNQAFSFSVSAGFDHVATTSPLSPAFSSWTPAFSASFGWQGSRGNCAVNFSRIATAGQGLLGAYDAKTISAYAGWQFARRWTGALSFGYSSTNSETPLTISAFPGGNTLIAGVSVSHPINDHFSTQFQYQRLRENYSSTAVIAADPDVNRESVTITYQISRPVGR